MSKSNTIVIFFKKINLFINKLLEKKLNILNRNNLLNILKSNKIFISLIALIILFLSYLSIPNIYNQTEVVNKLKNELTNEFQLNLRFSKKIDYKFFPRPHFITQEVLILHEKNEKSEIKNLKIFISLKNLFSLKNININDVVLDEVNFNLNTRNYNFFTKILNNNFLNTSLRVTNSKIFFRNSEREILFINKILKMKYFYNKKELKNVVHSENELFNIPYSIELYDDKDKKIIYTKLNINLFRLQIENEYDYKDKTKLGLANLVLNNVRTIFKYNKSKNFFGFTYFDKKDNQSFLYNGEIFFKPFFSNFNGSANEINLNYLFKSNGFITQLFKTEILNNNNFNLNINISADKILSYGSFVNLFLNSKIQEGLIDIDNTSFKWKNYAKINLFDSLIYVKNGELILDSNTQINILNHKEIYKFLITPKKYRNKIEKIDLNFSYNFDQKIIFINDIKIDNKSKQNVNEILKKISIKNDNLQNKIYFKKLLNKALKSYAG